MKKNLVFFLAIILIISNDIFSQKVQPPNIQNMEMNGTQIPVCSTSYSTGVTVEKYKKVELRFNLNDYYNNLDNAYNPDFIDITANFWSPSGKEYTIYGFMYQDYISTCSDYSLESIEKYFANPRLKVETINEASTIKPWRIRFTPNEVGTWTFRIIAKNSYDNYCYRPSSSNTSIRYSFNCTNSDNDGFVRIANSKFLKYDNGSPFYVLGENISNYEIVKNMYWNEILYKIETHPNDITKYGGVCEYKEYLDLLAANNVNTIRLFLESPESHQLNIVGFNWIENIFYYNRFNQKQSYIVDEIVNYAESKNIKIIMAIFNHGLFDSTKWENEYWAKKAFNVLNGGPDSIPKDYFTNQPTLKKQKDIVRYVVSRWGYSTSVLAWEVVNEVEQMINPQYYKPPIVSETELTTWHNNIAQYLSDIDSIGFNHIITTSVSPQVHLSQSSVDNINSRMDLIQSHRYGFASYDAEYGPEDYWNNVDYPDYFYREVKLRNTYNKPYIVGELGWTSDNLLIQNIDPHGFCFHQIIWAGSFNGSCGAPLYWYNKSNRYFGLDYHFKPLAKFWSNIPLTNNLESDTIIKYYHNIPIIHPKIRSFYLKKDSMIVGWVQNRDYAYHKLSRKLTIHSYLTNFDSLNKPAPFTGDNTIEFKNMLHGIYTIKWYNTNDTSGTVVATQTIMVDPENTGNPINKSLIITIPLQFLNSIYGEGAFYAYYDCDKNFWMNSTLNDLTKNHASGDIAINSIASQIYYRYNNNIYCIYYSNLSNSWQGGGPLVSTVNDAVGNIVVDNISGKIFYQTTNSIKCIYYNNSTGQWLKSDLNNAVTDCNGSLTINPLAHQIYYKTTSGSIGCLWQVSTTPEQWYGGPLIPSLQDVNGFLVAADNNSSRIFYKTNDYSIAYIYYNNTTGKWVNGGKLISTVTDVSGYLAYNSVTNNIFYKSTNNSIKRLYYENGWQCDQLNSFINDVSGYLAVHSSLNRVFYKSNLNSIKYIGLEGSTWVSGTLNNASKTYVDGFLVVNENTGSIYYKTLTPDNSVNMIYWGSPCVNSNFFKSGLNTTNEKENNNSFESPINFYNKIIRLYPNPTNSTLYIELNNDLNAELQITIFNSTGVIIKTLHTTEQNIEINTNEDSNGIYFVKITDTKNGISYGGNKFMIVH